MRFPISDLNSSGKKSFVCVKKAIHLWAFNCPPCTSAPVGQASIHFVQSPQLSSTGESGIKGIFRSEERRVGKESRAGGAPEDERKKADGAWGGGKMM